MKFPRKEIGILKISTLVLLSFLYLDSRFGIVMGVGGGLVIALVVSATFSLWGLPKNGRFLIAYWVAVPASWLSFKVLFAIFSSNEELFIIAAGASQAVLWIIAGYFGGARFRTVDGDFIATLNDPDNISPSERVRRAKKL